jgi:hypothetical protein
VRGHCCVVLRSRPPVRVPHHTPSRGRLHDTSAFKDPTGTARSYRRDGATRCMHLIEHATSLDWSGFPKTNRKHARFEAFEVVSAARDSTYKTLPASALFVAELCVVKRRPSRADRGGRVDYSVVLLIGNSIQSTPRHIRWRAVPRLVPNKCTR